MVVVLLEKIANKLTKLNENNVSYFVDDNPKLIGTKYLGKNYFL